MRLVLDTNILIAALVRDSVIREILIHSAIKCFVSEFIFKEVEKYKDEIIQKSCLSNNEFTSLLESIKEHLILVSDKEIHHKEEAEQIMEPIDIKDSIFIALALSTDNAGIWSEDKHFEQQKKIKVWKTKDVMRVLGILNHL